MKCFGMLQAHCVCICVCVCLHHSLFFVCHFSILIFPLSLHNGWFRQYSDNILVFLPLSGQVLAQGGIVEFMSMMLYLTFIVH